MRTSRLLMAAALATAMTAAAPAAPTGSDDNDVEDIAKAAPAAWSAALDDIAAYEASHAQHVAGAGSDGGQVCDIRLLVNNGYPERVAGTGLTETTVFAHDVASADIPCFSFDTFGDTYNIFAWVWFQYWDDDAGFNGDYVDIPGTVRSCAMNSLAGVGAMPCTNEQVYGRDIDHPNGEPAEWINAIHRSCFELFSPADAADDLVVACSKPWISADSSITTPLPSKG